MQIRLWPRLRRPWVLVLLGVLVLLVIARLLAPSLVRGVANKVLEGLGHGYTGRIEGAELRLWRGEIGLRELRVERSNGAVPVPYILVEEFVIAVVRDGYVPRVELHFRAPVVNYVDAKNEDRQQFGPPFDLAKLEQQLPLELAAVRIEDGVVHFRNYEAKPDIDAYLRDLDLTWTKLIGCLPPGSGACKSELRGSAQLLAHGSLSVRGHFDRAPKSVFDLHASLRNLKPSELSPLLRHYAKVDVESGQIDAELRYSRRGEGQSALLIPFLKDVKVMEGGDDGVRFFRELALASAAGYFERRDGKKAIAVSSKPGGGFEFELVDRPRE